jgi:hypothetical protein
MTWRKVGGKFRGDDLEEVQRDAQMDACKDAVENAKRESAVEWL